MVANFLALVESRMSNECPVPPIVRYQEHSLQLQIPPFRDQDQPCGISSIHMEMDRSHHSRPLTLSNHTPMFSQRAPSICDSATTLYSTINKTGLMELVRGFSLIPCCFLTLSVFPSPRSGAHTHTHTHSRTHTLCTHLGSLWLLGFLI